MKEQFSREYQFREKRALKVVKSTMTIVPIIDMEIFCQTVGWNLLGGCFFLFMPFLILIHLCKSHKQRANMLKNTPLERSGLQSLKSLHIIGSKLPCFEVFAVFIQLIYLCLGFYRFHWIWPFLFVLQLPLEVFCPWCGSLKFNYLFGLRLNFQHQFGCLSPVYFSRLAINLSDLNITCG